MTIFSTAPLAFETVLRVATQGKISRQRIAAQTGNYLGEDDIERFENVYKRPTP